jgi:hypothetical protein
MAAIAFRSSIRGRPRFFFGLFGGSSGAMLAQSSSAIGYCAPALRFLAAISFPPHTAMVCADPGVIFRIASFSIPDLADTVIGKGAYSGLGKSAYLFIADRGSSG